MPLFTCLSHIKATPIPPLVFILPARFFSLASENAISELSLFFKSSSSVQLPGKLEMLGSNTNLVTTAIGFGMSATFIVFVCTRIICGRLRGSSESHNMLEFEPRMDMEQQWQQPGHLVNRPEPVLVTAIPTMKFDREAFSSIENTQCVICLADYNEREVLRIMPKCGHSFHLSCIDIWLRKQSTCPVCRLPLQNSSETKHVRPVTFSLGQGESQTSESRDSERSIEPVPGNPFALQQADTAEAETRQ